jgi:LPS-assembly protein
VSGVRCAVVAFLLACLAAGTAPAQVRQVQERGDQEPIVFVADELRVDQDLNLVVATGNVEIAQGRRRLLADTVTYNQRTDTITAAGHVSLMEPTGEVIFAEYVELTDQMNEAFARDIRMIMTDRARLAGNTGRRTGGKRIEVRRGVYSPCDLCPEDPSRAPIWQIKAGSVVHDEEQRLVEYRDAILELGGIPVLYVPYLSHPDPTVKRQTGFLPATFGHSNNLGFNTTVPFFWAIAPDKDFTFSPIFTGEAGQVAAGEYRQRFGFGSLDVSGSIVDDEVPVSSRSSATRSDLRGHLFANGAFDIDETWRTGFEIRRASDQTYLRRYRFGGTETALTSSGFVEGFTPRSYASAKAYGFQALRQFRSDGQLPVVGPVMGYNWVGQPDDWGGRWAVDANLLNLWREDGNDNRRLSLGSEWRLPFFGPAGTVWSFGAGMRGDGYSVGDLALPDGSEKNGFEGRVFPQVALETRWPWIRRGPGFTQLVEPIVGFYAAPNGLNRSGIPNDDSVVFDFGDQHLFSRNRFAGYDRVDDGQRVDYGLRAAVYGDGLGYSQVVIGQSYRLQDSSSFAVGSGLEDRLSDIVGRVTVAPTPLLDLIYRFRLDHGGLGVDRQEVTVAGGPEQLRLFLSFLDLPPVVDETGPRKEVSAGLSLGLTRYWRLAFSTTRDITGGDNSLSNVARAIYQDECLAFTVTLAQSGTRDRDIEPGTTIYFTLVLKNLGELVAEVYSTTDRQ